MSSEGLLSGLFAPDVILEATSERAWAQALLDAEAALAAAEAEAGLIPAAAAQAIAAACDASDFDLAAIGREGRAVANPVAPLVAALRERVGDEAADFVHYGATSQDVMDTAAMLVAAASLRLIDAELDRVATACAALAEAHRETPIAARTLLQQALPTSFGLKAAGWLDSVLDARERLGSISLAVQLGGAAGTLASLEPAGDRLVGQLASRLDLEEPNLPWHTARFRIGDLGSSLALAAGVVEKIGLDIALLSQTEVGEVAESGGGGRGGSTALPHKRNPVGAVLAIACARRVRGAAGILLEAIAQEHERAAGAWHSEWEPLREALALTGGAAAAIADALEGLEVSPERMRENLEATRGLVMAESVVGALGDRVGRGRARKLVEAACERAIIEGTPLRDQLIGDQAIREELDEKEIDRALDPVGYLGSAGTFVDRALARHRGYGEKQRER